MPLKPKFSSRLVHDLYQRVRPYFEDWGVLSLMRRVLPERSRWDLADRLGLASFQVLGATGRRLPAARARTLAGPRRVRRGSGLLAGHLRDRPDLGAGRRLRAQHARRSVRCPERRLLHPVRVLLVLPVSAQSLLSR